MGGSDRAAQAQSLAGKPDIIVATPGRLIDLADSADSALSMSPVCLSMCLSRPSTCCTQNVHGQMIAVPRQDTSCEIDLVRPMITAKTNSFHSF